jgi:hypothetical protein
VNVQPTASGVGIGSGISTGTRVRENTATGAGLGNGISVPTTQAQESATGVGKGFGQAESTITIPGAVTEGLVAWYRMENTNNDVNTVVDATNNLRVGADQTAFTGTVQGVSFQSNGGVRDVVTSQNPSGAYEFDGVDDTIQTTFSENLSNWTLMGWVKVDDRDSETLLATQKLGQGDGFSFGVRNGGIEANVFAGSNPNAANKGIARSSMSPNTQHHIAFASDGEVYLDGSSVVNIGSVGSLPAPRGARMGANFNPNNFFEGIADDVRIYNRALSGTKVNQVYQNTEP